MNTACKSEYIEWVPNLYRSLFDPILQLSNEQPNFNPYFPDCPKEDFFFAMSILGIRYHSRNLIDASKAKADKWINDGDWLIQQEIDIYTPTHRQWIVSAERFHKYFEPFPRFPLSYMPRQKIIAIREPKYPGTSMIVCDCGDDGKINVEHEPYIISVKKFEEAWWEF